MSKLIQQLREAYVANYNETDAKAIQAYLKHKFGSFGIKHGPRRMIDKEVLSGFEKVSDQTVKELMDQDEREFHHCAVEILKKQKKFWDKNTIELIEWLILHKSWWDTVDSLATFHTYWFFKKYPELEEQWIYKWIQADNMWLNRAAIIFQIKRKRETDLNLLKDAILPHLQSKEFFHQKAIGWALREVGTYHPEWVLEFCDNHQLAALSRREALRKLIH